MKLEITVSIKSTDVSDKSGVKDGKPWRIVEQTAWADMGKEYPVEIKVPVNPDGNGEMKAYPVGTYMIDPGCVYVQRYGKLGIANVRLNPVAAAASQKRA